MDGKRGWMVVFGAFVAMAITSGIELFVLPVTLKSIIEETGWSLTTVSVAVTVWGLSAAAVSPLCGILIDRLGARTMMLAGIVLAGVMTFLIGRVTEPWQLYVVMILFALAGVSSTYIPVAAVVARWFVKHRGAATGVAMLSIFIGGATFPLLTSALLEQYSWREVYAIFGGMILLAIIPVLAFVRNPPVAEEQAYLASIRSADHSAGDLTLSAALGTRSFWGLSVGDMLTGLVFAVFNVHLVYYLTVDLDNEAVAAQAFAALNGALAVGTLLFGLLGDRLPLRGVLVACYFFPMLAMPVLMYGSSVQLAVLAFAFAVFAGLPAGGRNALFPVALVHCFGETHLGAIYGLSNTFFMVGNALGPVLAAQLFERGGGSQPVYIGCMVLLLISSGLVALIRREHGPATP